MYQCVLLLECFHLAFDVAETVVGNAALWPCARPLLSLRGYFVRYRLRQQVFPDEMDICGVQLRKQVFKLGVYGEVVPVQVESKAARPGRPAS